MTEREEFESIYHTAYTSMEDGKYKNSGVQADWNTFCRGVQAAKESSRKELEAANNAASYERTRMQVKFKELEAARTLISQFDSCIRSIADALGNPACGGVDVPISDPLGTASVLVGAVEAAKQRIAELERDNKAHCTSLMTTQIWIDIEAEKEALEKRLAEQQAVFAKTAKAFDDLSFSCFGGIGVCAPNLGIYNSTFEVLAEQREYLKTGKAAELTKREAAARAEGFEEGRKAGRDELQKVPDGRITHAKCSACGGYVPIEDCGIHFCKLPTDEKE